MPDNTLDARRITRDQQTSVTTSVKMAANAMKPVIGFQVAMMRAATQNMELIAEHVEKALESFGKESS